MPFYHGIYYVLLLVVIIKSEEHFQTDGSFGRSHLKIDPVNPYNCNQSITASSRFTLSSTVTIADLQVSSTHYSNNEQIEVSWVPLTAPCKDDFIGVYFVEIPLNTGKYGHLLWIRSQWRNRTP